MKHMNTELTEEEVKLMADGRKTKTQIKVILNFLDSLGCKV